MTYSLLKQKKQHGKEQKCWHWSCPSHQYHRNQIACNSFLPIIMIRAFQPKMKPTKIRYQSGWTLEECILCRWWFHEILTCNASTELLSIIICWCCGTCNHRAIKCTTEDRIKSDLETDELCWPLRSTRWNGKSNTNKPKMKEINKSVL